MSMNRVIMERRKELGFTQEQVANYLGVSTPAVSKWEKGITSPDIGLLLPLARLLKIDLNTLFCFQEELTQQEINAFCKEITMTAQNDIKEAFQVAEEKFHEYPHHEELWMDGTVCLEAALIQSALTEEEKKPFEEQIEGWYACLMKSTEEKIYSTAKFMMVSRYIRQKKLDLAQSVLDTIPDRKEMTRNLPDKLMLQVSIYLKQGKADLAAASLERDLFSTLNRVQMLMYQLVDAELANHNKDVAEKIAEKCQKVTELLDMWDYSGLVPIFQMKMLEKDAEQVMEVLEKMLEALKEPYDFREAPLFYRMAPEKKRTDAKQMLDMLLKSMETDPECDYLRENPRFVNLIEKYKSC